jgi:DNA-directed RNA polymerase subunit H (RpoH/RPB5)
MVKRMSSELSNKSTQVNFGKKFNKTYKIKLQTLAKQFTGEVYPYLRDDDEIPSRVGQFRFENGSMAMIKDQDELMNSSTHETEVLFGNIPKMDDKEGEMFHQIPSTIYIETGDESTFKGDMVGLYRMRINAEIFHVQHLVYDVFQHWLVPSQRILNDAEKLMLLCHYYVNALGEAKKNCLFLESQLPTVPMSDAAMRRLGAIPGNIVYWENESYLATLDNVESGYMLVTGVVSDVSKVVGSEAILEQEDEDLESDGEEDEDDLDGNEGDYDGFEEDYI